MSLSNNVQAHQELAQIQDALAQLADSSSNEFQREQLDKFYCYLQLMRKWNKTYNLTAIRDFTDMLSKHLLDSLVVAPYIDSQSLLDVGSGAGLPGIPLAIANTEKHITVLDSSSKKTRFLQHVKQELDLWNVDVIHSRVEQYCGTYTAIISRAFSSLNDMYRWTQHLMAENACLYAMAGAYPTEQLQQLTQELYLQEAHALSVPMLQAQRHLLILKRRQHMTT